MAASTSAGPGRVFISYRRDDSGFPAGWLYDRLRAHLGSEQVFKDVDSIDPGDDFFRVIEDAVGSCQVLLALIGDRWLDITDETGKRRLDDPDDFVRLEIQAALHRDVRLVPILVGRAPMPRSHQLPDSLRGLVRRQAIKLSPDRFESDLARLVRVIDKTLAAIRDGPAEAPADASGVTQAIGLDGPGGVAVDSAGTVDVPVSDIPSGKPIDGPLTGHTDWVTSMTGDFWGDLLAYIRQQVLVTVTGPDLSVVNVGNTEQTFTSLIGQRLAERYQLTVSPGVTTMDEAVAAFLRERGQDEVERLYRVINDIIVNLDPAPGDALRDLAAITDLRLFVNTTPDQLLAQAVNEVRFQGRSATREITFSPNQSAREQERNAHAAANTDTVVLNLFGQATTLPQYATHEEDRLEWLHALLSDPASLPGWLNSQLKRQPVLFVGCEISDSIAGFLLRIFSSTRLSLERKQFFVVGSSASHIPSLSPFSATYRGGAQVQQLDMAPTEFVAELRARWEALSPDATIFISYMREDAHAARRLANAITRLGGDVWLDERWLIPGDAWEQEVLTAIRRTIRLFIPVISANTEREQEGHVFREWREAVDRSRSIRRRFIVPVVVDKSYDPSRYRQIPGEFEDLDFGHAPAGDPDERLAAMLRDEIRAMRRTDAN